MKIKLGADPNVKKVMKPVLSIYDLYCKSVGKEGVLTSGIRPPDPNSTSLHPLGYAVDLRGKHLSTAERKTLSGELKTLDVFGFQTIYYPETMHWHIEWDRVKNYL